MVRRSLTAAAHSRNASSSLNLPVLVAPGMTVVPITSSDLTALTSLCVRCTEFFQLVEGRDGSREVAEEILALLPPGGSARQKHLVGFLHHDELVALADLGEDYPGPHDWYVALFLVTPAGRNVGLGAQVWHAVEAWVRAQRGVALRLAVQQQNPRARHFWERLGFTVIGEITQRADGGGSRVWQMWKPLLAFNEAPVADVARG